MNTATESINDKHGLGATCRKACRHLKAELTKTKEAIIAEFRYALRGNERLLRLAVSEAEALAWQTDFPHLVFPALAIEKAEAAVAWTARQQFVQRTTSQWAFAA